MTIESIAIVSRKKKTDSYESKRMKHSRLLKEDPSRAQELQNKLSAEILTEIILNMCWYGSSARETADIVSRRFEQITKKEIHTATLQLAYVSKSRVFRYLNTKSTKKYQAAS
jgi:hypothetical protein